MILAKSGFIQKYSKIGDTHGFTESLDGDDEYFVLGDNRNNSQDSRYESVGNIQKRDMLGTVWFEVSGDGFGFLQ